MTTTPTIKTSYTMAEVLDIASGRVPHPAEQLARELLRIVHTEPLLAADTGLLADYDELPIGHQDALKRVAVGYVQLVTPVTREVRR